VTNFAFIDGQNLYKGIQNLGWKVDLKKFRIHLKDKFKVEKAYFFIGRLDDNQALYNMLEEFGYTLIFKEVLKLKNGTIKGNVDTELVLQAMIEYDNYDEAIIVAGDGDYGCLVRYLEQKKKFRIVISPTKENTSILLKRACNGRITFLNESRNKFEYK
jgi:uncharacterized LabA/DUF88 family protein